MKKTIVMNISDIDNLPISVSGGFWGELIDLINDLKYSHRDEQIVVTIETQG